MSYNYEKLSRFETAGRVRQFLADVHPHKVIEIDWGTGKSFRFAWEILREIAGKPDEAELDFTSVSKMLNVHDLSEHSHLPLELTKCP